jgi:hypothetical protein
MSDVWNAQFCVVLDDHLEDKIRNGKWWEDRGHKIGTVGQWLYLCTSSNSRFVPSSVVICGRVDRHEIVNGMYSNEQAGTVTYRTYFSEAYVVNVSIGRVVGEGKPRAKSCSILLGCSRSVLSAVVSSRPHCYCNIKPEIIVTLFVIGTLAVRHE